MQTIQVNFERSRDVRFGNRNDAFGMYVFWDRHARARPTYTGRVTSRGREVCPRDLRAARSQM